jgi:acylphosphatase
MDSETKAVRVRVAGRVQGVGFRDWTRREAMALGLVGWVRNEADGSVTAMIAGPEATVSVMIERLWRGPKFASVSDVTVQPAALADLPSHFRIAG